MNNDTTPISDVTFESGLEPTAEPEPKEEPILQPYEMALPENAILSMLHCALFPPWVLHALLNHPNFAPALIWFHAAARLTRDEKAFVNQFCLDRPNDSRRALYLAVLHVFRSRHGRQPYVPTERPATVPTELSITSNYEQVGTVYGSATYSAPSVRSGSRCFGVTEIAEAFYEAGDDPTLIGMRQIRHLVCEILNDEGPDFHEEDTDWENIEYDNQGQTDQSYEDSPDYSTVVSDEFVAAVIARVIEMNNE